MITKKFIFSCSLLVIAIVAIAMWKSKTKLSKFWSSGSKLNESNNVIAYAVGRERYVETAIDVLTEVDETDPKVYDIRPLVEPMLADD